MIMIFDFGFLDFGFWDFGLFIFWICDFVFWFLFFHCGCLQICIFDDCRPADVGKIRHSKKLMQNDPQQDSCFMQLSSSGRGETWICQKWDLSKLESCLTDSSKWICQNWICFKWMFQKWICQKMDFSTMGFVKMDFWKSIFSKWILAKCIVLYQNASYFRLKYFVNFFYFVAVCEKSSCYLSYLYIYIYIKMLLIYRQIIQVLETNYFLQKPMIIPDYKVQ
jgi:hypothetical protein